MFKTTLLLILVLFFQINSYSYDVLTIEKGHYVKVETNIIDPAQPTFVLLPGVYRALNFQDEVLKMAKKQKLNFISIHTSLHPESLNEIPDSEVPYFQFKKISLVDLAQEIVSVIEYYKLQRPIPVGLSYSSAISSELAKMNIFELVVETAPMIRFDESDPSGSATSDFWKNYFDMFPGFGSIFKDQFLAQIYTAHWNKELPNLIQRYPDYDTPKMKSLMVKGYTALSMAVDGFDYREQDFKNSSKRAFLLGQDEMEHRFELQKEAIAKYESETGHKKSTKIIDAGHVIPNENPTEYLKFLKSVVKSLN